MSFARVAALALVTGVLSGPAFAGPVVEYRLPVTGDRSPVKAPASPPQGVVDLDGQAIDLLRVPDTARAAVLVFTTTDCPISNRYAPEIQRLSRRFQSSGIRFWLVYPVPADTPAKIREHVSAFSYDLPVVRDTAFELVRRMSATVTPEVAVIERGGRLVYRGRIDDRYVDFGVDRPAPTTRDLERVLTAVASGHRMEPTTTRAVGCYLTDVLK
jgi:hypothetical protein